MSSREHKISILVADDHPIARKGLRALFAEVDDMELVGEAQDGFEARDMVSKLHPEILLLDLKMPGPSPSELEEWVRENYPETITLVLTAHDRDFYLAGMMEAGVAGYLIKNERTENLITAIRRAANGESLFTQEQLERAWHWRKIAGRNWDSLTERERTILKLILDGKSNADIANTVGVTSRTVAYHITNIFNKLEVHSRQDVISWAHRYLSDNLE